jgi:hypothetical protein
MKIRHVKAEFRGIFQSQVSHWQESILDPGLYHPYILWLL